MRYLGGKSRQASAITATLIQVLAGHKEYAEPFCGALGAAVKAIPALAERGVEKFTVSDANPMLIEMWRQAKAGWEPPDFVSEDEFKRIREVCDPKDPMTAYCGFSLAFSGAWGNVYARPSKNLSPEKRHEQTVAYHAASKRGVMAKAKMLADYGVNIECKEYHEFDFGTGTLVYADPPYASSMKTQQVRRLMRLIDSEFLLGSGPFWAWAEQTHASGATLLVSEYDAPEGWNRIHSWGDTTVRHRHGKEDDKGKNNESLFMFGGR